MSDAKQGKDMPTNYDDIISKLKAVPEKQFPDISDKVMSAVKHEKFLAQQFYKRMLYSGIGVGAAAVALCVGLGVVMSNQPIEPDEATFASSKKNATVLEMPVAVSNTQTTIYDAVAMLQQLDANEIDPADERFASLVNMLVSNQKANGFLGDVFADGENNYNHSVATLMLIKLYESGAFPEVFTPLDAALGYIRNNQTELGGWGDVYGGSYQIGILNVAVLGSAQELGWSDMAGHLRRGLRCLESNTNAGLNKVKTISEKLAIVQKLGKQIYSKHNS